MLVLGGGEPLWRRDVFDLAKLAAGKNLSVALATNGTLIDETMAQRIEDAGILRVSIGLDGADRVTHDTFRGVDGAFEAAISGLGNLVDLGISTEINTSISRHNVHQLPGMLKLARSLGAVAFHIFPLLPVTCGLAIPENERIGPEEYEQALGWLYEHSQNSGLEVKATCAPHYERLLRQRWTAGGRESRGVGAVSRGCFAGSGGCFISYRGEVYPCGHLPVTAGNLGAERFSEIWENSRLFAELRDPLRFEGKCGACEFTQVCSGCRALAFGLTGSHLAAEPFCVYQPEGAPSASFRP